MPPLNVFIRVMDAIDLPEIVRIERASFPDAWTQKKFAVVNARPGTAILVAEDSFRRVVGYLVWERGENAITILNLAVEAEARRRGVGWELVKSVRGSLAVDPRSRAIRVSVKEDDVAAQLFFRSSGFRATGIVADTYDAWIDFEFVSPHDEGVAVLRSILEGDGRRVA